MRNWFPKHQIQFLKQRSSCLSPMTIMDFISKLFSGSWSQLWHF